MAHMKSDIPKPRIEKLTIPEIAERFKPGKGQFSRFGSEHEWEVDTLVDDLDVNFDVNKVNIEASGTHAELYDGNRTATALVILYGRDPKRWGMKIPVQVYDELTPEQADEVRLRAARAVKAWSRVDFYHAMTNIIMAYPGDPSEDYLVERIGPHRIRQQWPNAFKTDDKGELMRKENGGYVLRNRQGPIQDAKRLARLPECVREAFYKGLAGKGPVIQPKALSTLAKEHEKDVAAGLRAPESLNDVRANLGNGSALAAILVPFLDAETGNGRGPGAGMMSVKDIDKVAADFAGTPFNILFRFVKREVGFIGELPFAQLKKLGKRLTVLMSEDDEAKAVYNKILADAEAVREEAAKAQETETETEAEDKS